MIFPLVIGALLAIGGAGGGYFAISSGLVRLDESHSATAPVAPEALPNIAFVEMAPLVVSLTDQGRMVHLRFRAQIEVVAGYKHDVERVQPRIVDVLNTYLRTLEMTDLTAPQALTVLRGQMLRRIQIVVGEGRVRDLLIMEFVLT